MSTYSCDLEIYQRSCGYINSFMVVVVAFRTFCFVRDTHTRALAARASPNAHMDNDP